jgi:hypothetical protein
VVVVATVLMGVVAFGFVRLGTFDPPAPVGTDPGDGASPTLQTAPSSADAPGTATNTPSSDAGCDEPVGSLPEEQPGVVPALIADYLFQGSLASSVGVAPDLVEVLGSGSYAEEDVRGQIRSAWTFSRGTGLSLAPTAGVVDRRAYSIELLFRFSQIDGYRKIVDVSGGSSDNGLYVLDGCLIFYPREPSSRGNVPPEDYVHVVLTRDRAGMVVGYIDGIQAFSFRDLEEDAVIGRHGTLRFFVDDRRTESEDTGGAVTRIRLYDGALSGSDVAGLACAEVRSCG